MISSTLRKLKIENIDIESIETEKDVEKIENLVYENKIESILKSDLVKIKALLYHRQISKRQRNSYNFLKKNFKTNELFIELDWKQKVAKFHY